MYIALSDHEVFVCAIQAVTKPGVAKKEMFGRETVGDGRIIEVELKMHGLFVEGWIPQIH